MGDLYAIVGRGGSGKINLLNRLAPNATYMSAKTIRSRIAGGHFPPSVKGCTVAIRDTNKYVAKGTIHAILEDARKIGDVYVVFQSGLNLIQQIVWSQFRRIHCMTDLDTLCVTEKERQRTVVNNHCEFFEKVYHLDREAYGSFESALRNDLREMVRDKRVEITVKGRYC
jgi:hypothetical protein